jgi:hypothetical protein
MTRSGAAIDWLSAGANKPGRYLGQANSDANNEYHFVFSVTGAVAVILG